MTTVHYVCLIPLCFLAPLAAAQDAPAPAATAPAASSSAIATADELLIALETADKDITTLQATLKYIKKPNELVGGSNEIRDGQLWFFTRPQVPAPPVAPDSTDAPPPPPQPTRLFQVEFTTLELDGARRDDRQVWVFDGHWLIEKNFKTRMLFRREVVRPGEKADPLAIGEGPLPIPIGQKREKILERFEATLVPFGEGFPDSTPPGSLATTLATTYQLHLKPKRGTQEARDYREVRIWYRQDDLLPRLARATHKDGSSTEIFLTGVQVNKDLAEAVFDTRLPEGWNEQIEDFRQAKNAEE